MASTRSIASRLPSGGEKTASRIILTRAPMKATDMIAQTAEVRVAHRFDVAALERYMRAHVDGLAGSLAVLQFRGGQSNPTYYLAAGGREYVLRRKPPGKLLPSAHAL